MSLLKRIFGVKRNVDVKPKEKMVEQVKSVLSENTEAKVEGNDCFLTPEQIKALDEINQKYEDGTLVPLPVKDNNIRRFVGNNSITRIASEALDSILPSNSGPFNAKELRELLGEDFEIESMTEGEKDIIFDEGTYKYPTLKKEYLKKVAYRLYDELKDSDEVFTNYIHFGNDFSKYGLDRSHYITNISNDKFYFTNEIASLIRESIMSEVFCEKLITLKDNCFPIASDNPFVSMSEFYTLLNKHFRSLFNKSDEETDNIQSKSFSFAVKNERMTTDGVLKDYLSIEDIEPIENSSFKKKASNKEITELYKDTISFFNKMPFNKYYKKENGTGDELLDFVLPGVKLIYGQEVSDKLCHIIKNGNCIMPDSSNELNFNFVFKELIEQFKHYYVKARRYSFSKDISKILKGAKGENTVSKHLELYDDEMVILDNLTIGFRDKKAECDSILITKFGIFVLECKNFANTGHYSLKISSDGAWSRIITNEETKEKVVEPIERSATLQNIEHARILQRALKDLLGDEYSTRFNVSDFVVISNDVVQIENDSDQKVFRISSIYNHISKFEEKISEDEFEFLKESIQKCAVEASVFDYFDYKGEFIHLLKTVLSYFDKFGGFKNLVEKAYDDFKDLSNRQSTLLEEFCKVEAQLLYIYKNYDSKENTSYLKESTDPFKNGEFYRALDKFMKDIKSTGNSLVPLTTGSIVLLNSKLHSKLITNKKESSWDISERYFYPEVDENNDVIWSDNYLAKYNNILKEDVINTKGVELFKKFKETYSDDKYLSVSNTRKVDMKTITSAIVEVVVKSMFTTYYFKPKHIYSDYKKSVDVLKDISFNNSISLGNSKVTLKERPNYAKTAVVFLVHSFKYGDIVEEIDLEALSNKTYSDVDKVKWFSKIYDKRVDFILKSLYTTNSTKVLTNADLRNETTKLDEQMKNETSKCKNKRHFYNSDYYMDDNNGAFAFSCNI